MTLELRHPSIKFWRQKNTKYHKRYLKVLVKYCDYKRSPFCLVLSRLTGMLTFPARHDCIVSRYTHIGGLQAVQQ